MYRAVNLVRIQFRCQIPGNPSWNANCSPGSTSFLLLDSSIKPPAWTGISGLDRVGRVSTGEQRLKVITKPLKRVAKDETEKE